MKVLVVTGGIGSGKSQVCRLLSEKFGIPVYEADSRAKALYMEVPDMLDRIEAALGTGLRNDRGEFVPGYLSDMIFADPSALRKVEDILFPVLKKDFSDWAERQGSSLVAFESATILEKAAFDGFGDIVLLVDAPVSLRLMRAAARDCADTEKIRSRMEAQTLMNRLSEGGVDTRVDHVLKNDSTIEDLEANLSEFIEKYRLTKML